MLRYIFSISFFLCLSTAFNVEASDRSRTEISSRWVGHTYCDKKVDEISFELTPMFEQYGNGGKNYHKPINNQFLGKIKRAGHKPYSFSYRHDTATGLLKYIPGTFKQTEFMSSRELKGALAIKGQLFYDNQMISGMTIGKDCLHFVLRSRRAQQLPKNYWDTEALLLTKPAEFFDPDASRPDKLSRQAQALLAKRQAFERILSVGIATPEAHDREAYHKNVHDLKLTQTLSFGGASYATSMYPYLNGVWDVVIRDFSLSKQRYARYEVVCDSNDNRKYSPRASRMNALKLVSKSKTFDQVNTATVPSARFRQPADKYSGSQHLSSFCESITRGEVTPTPESVAATKQRVLEDTAAAAVEAETARQRRKTEGRMTIADMAAEPKLWVEEWIGFTRKISDGKICTRLLSAVPL